MPDPHLAEPQLAVLLLIDAQERLMPHIAGHQALVENAARALRAAAVLGLPILATEQNPDGLGQTVAPLRALLPAAGTPFRKETFSCWPNRPFRDALRATHREHVIVAGIEAHVCVQQTVLDLLRVDYLPFVLADAVGSRRATDRDVALDRMRHAGAVVTTVEAVIMELQQRYTSPTFKPILDIIR